MDLSLQEVQGLRLAIEGCGHGTLNAIYSAIDKACEVRRWRGVDLLIIGGDFQAVRNAHDLTVMSCPVKYREIGDFHEYYSGMRKAPCLTIFIGGNHEASSHLWELHYGGWVAPSIFYMGAANVVRLGSLRIAGMSGIWKGYNFNKTHFERLPYNQDDIKSIYHMRELDMRKLLQIRTQVDIGISHDWPRSIEHYGDKRQLFRSKPDFEQESNDGTFGNVAAAYIMDRLRPQYWFAAHMHCKFAATRTYDDALDTPEKTSVPTRVAISSAVATLNPDILVLAHNADEIDLDMDEDDATTPPMAVSNSGDAPISNGSGATKLEDEPSTILTLQKDLRAQLPASFARPSAPPRMLTPGQPTPLTIKNKTVRFLALDKCLPGRKFLQLLDIEPSSSSLPPAASNLPKYHLEYDPEWLAITRVFATALTLGDRNAKFPPDLGEEHYRPLIEAEEIWVEENIVQKGKLAIPENFTITAPTHVQGSPEIVQAGPEEYNNPQMAAFCELLGIENKFFATDEERAARATQGPAPSENLAHRGGGRGGGRGREERRGRGRGRGRGRRW